MSNKPKKSIANKLQAAIKEKRFFKTFLSFFVSLIFGKDKYVKTYSSLDYAFGKKELAVTRRFISQISQTPKKDKITVVFVIWMAEMWNSLRSVYETAVKNPLFDVYILAQPHLFDSKNQKGQNPAYELFSKMYGSKNVVNAFREGKWFDLKNLAPDYVFYSYPYENEYYDLYKAASVREYAKVCLIQYGYTFEIDSTFFVAYGFDFSRNVAIQFASNDTTKENLKTLYHHKNVTPKIKSLGYPLFDLAEKAEPNGKTLLWTPRYTTKVQKYNKQSHFLNYYKEFINFAKNHPDVTVIIRPHPLMFANFLRTGVMTQDEIDDFKAQCNFIPNVELDQNADYIPSVKRASVIVSDFSALLAEFFVMGKPVIYCDGNNSFSKEAMIMDNSLYHAKSWSEIENQVLAVLSGKDEMKEKRITALKEFLPNGDGTTAERILAFIKQDYYGV